MANRGRQYLLLADEDLISLVQASGPEAFAALYDRHGRAAYSLAYRMMGERQAAEDLVQDAFLKVHGRGGGRSGTSPRRFPTLAGRDKGVLERPEPSGLFEAEEESVAVVVEKPLDEADAIAVTVEPDGGSPQSTSDPMLTAKL